MKTWSDTRRPAAREDPRGARSAGAPPVRTPADARQLVRHTLAALGPLRPAQVEDLLLVTSELVTNAHRHAGGVTGFGIGVEHDRVTVSVSDASGQTPLYERPADLRPGGYGWPIVLRLCHEVTVDAGPDGKTIHAAVAVERCAVPEPAGM
ncbi:anti-sigma regulatory factor (Ser/Thr protein kinase) [Streptomyces sp. PvR006]|uniref:ATP-binding protein n=1 Tax=Streptomyces sp. PvR006 TaxID=2817860 RepID=UPI001AE3F4F5|nr:ATP-binding protein [Streptomyces sp. PvR006]MBP2580116.1 anti-sigma regulatory factor (Ser/Thr protein kinase) [Streptomyces sp. PvR006]